MPRKPDKRSITGWLNTFDLVLLVLFLLTLAGIAAFQIDSLWSDAPPVMSLTATVLASVTGLGGYMLALSRSMTAGGRPIDGAVGRSLAPPAAWGGEAAEKRTYTMQVAPDVDAMLWEAARESGTDLGDIVRRALGLYDFGLKGREKGLTLALVDPSTGKIEKVVTGLVGSPGAKG